jgi:hypothetical protein
MAKTRSINITVLVEESHKNKLSQVSRELKDKGFVLKETLGEIGVLTGSVPSTALGDLSKVPGVSAVEKERTDYRPQD